MTPALQEAWKAFVASLKDVTKATSKAVSKTNQKSL